MSVAGQRGPVLAGLLGGKNRVVLVGMLLQVRLDVGDGVDGRVELGRRRGDGGLPRRLRAVGLVVQLFLPGR